MIRRHQILRAAAAFVAAGTLVAGLLPTAEAQGPLGERRGTLDALAGRGVFLLEAGTVHLVEGGEVLRPGRVLVRDGKIVAVGKDLAAPADAEVVDFGPGAVLLPGLVSAYSPYARGAASPRTAAPGVRSLDTFDFYADFTAVLESGVTSVYIAPADYRLISGQGAVVKLTGTERSSRILNPTAALHGAIDAQARRTPGYWTPPVPATADAGMGPAVRQLPRSTMGAVVALDELVAAARSDDPEAGADLYGADSIRDLRRAMEAGVPWRIAAVRASEIRALLDFAKRAEVPLILDKATEAKGLASEIAAAQVPVVFRVPFEPNSPARDHGKAEDARWPSFDVPAALVKAGARVAIAGSSPSDLLFFAALASKGGLAEEDALRAITLTPAEISGVADRVGSIAPGKDADFCVLNADPLSGFASVLSTWVDGKEVWSVRSADSARASDAVVLEVDELHVGDGTVLRPGAILFAGGKILEVGPRVARPLGARVLHGAAAMPGMIDALGFLGLEGDRKVPSTSFKMARIVSPGDETDRRVAEHGVTTVVLSPRGSSSSGAPVMAYRPAGEELDSQVIGDPVALRVNWRNSNRALAGKSVTELLEKGAAYRQKWIDYEKALSEWTPPAEEPSADKAGDEEEGEDAEAESEDGDEPKKKDKKDKKDELEPDPITGRWVGMPEGHSALKLWLLFEAGEGSGAVTGNLRCDDLSDILVRVEGHWNREDNVLGLKGLGSDGWISFEAKVEEGKLVGEVHGAEAGFEFELERTLREYVVAGRTERKEEEAEEKAEPKGKPKPPRVDEKLEPVRRALDGKLTMIVEVDRADEILACVETFERFGIQPVLLGAADAWKVADEIAGRVRGVLIGPRMRIRDPKRGSQLLTPYALLQSAGVPVAFHSDAEEGAIDLPIEAAYAVANGMSPTGALRALTADAAAMMSIDEKVGTLAPGKDADVLLLDGPPLAPGTSVEKAFVAGEEVQS